MSRRQAGRKNSQSHRRKRMSFDIVTPGLFKTSVDISLQATSAMSSALPAEMPEGRAWPHDPRQNWIDRYRTISDHSSASGTERRLVDAYAELLAVLLALHDERMHESVGATLRPTLTVVGGYEHQPAL